MRWRKIFLSLLFIPQHLILCLLAEWMKAPKVVVCYDASGNQFVFTQSIQEQTPTCNPKDITWAVVHEKEQDESEIYQLYTHKERGEVKVDLPED